MWILGVAGSHNGAVALTRDGEVVAAVQAERLTRLKRHMIRLDRLGTDLRHLARYCLDQAGIGPADIDLIATSSPWAAAPRLSSPAHWFGATADRVPRFLTTPHHLAHAEYAIHYSPLEPAIVLVLDGSGTLESQRPHLEVQEREDKNAVKHLHGIAKESISAYAFDGRELALIYRFASDVSPHAEIPGAGRPYLQSVGHLWRWAAYYCSGDLSEAGKVMGLAPYGDPGRFAHLRTLELDDRTGDVAVSFEGLERLGRPNVDRRDVTGDAHYQDVAAHVQAVTSDLLVRLARFLQARVPARHLCYTGGVALNCIANEALIRATPCQVHMNGSCEDNGTAIGAALSAYHHRTGRRRAEKPREHYGRVYSDHDVERALSSRGILAAPRPRREVSQWAARALALGRVIGWFQGRAEFGPRALGSRSILADPRDPSMVERLNVEVKSRERYRPYAPAVVEERATEFFDFDGVSPSMLRAVPVKVGFLPAITHVDGSARVQTVSALDHPTFHQLLCAFGEITGVPVLLNTSFNAAGQPIVESPEDAIEAFMAMGFDALVLENRIVERTDLSASLASAARRDGAPDVLRELREADVLVVPRAPRWLSWTSPHGEERDILRLYGPRGVAQLEIDALPLIEALCRCRRFVAREATAWGAYTWEDARGALLHLVEGGFLEVETSSSGAGRRRGPREPAL